MCTFALIGTHLCCWWEGLLGRMMLCRSICCGLFFVLTAEVTCSSCFKLKCLRHIFTPRITCSSNKRLRNFSPSCPHTWDFICLCKRPKFINEVFLRVTLQRLYSESFPWTVSIAHCFGQSVHLVVFFICSHFFFSSEMEFSFLCLFPSCSC